MVATKNEETHESRIARLETVVTNIHEDLTALNKNVSHLATETRDAIKVMSDKISESQKTPWNTLGTWAAVVISVIVLGGSGFVRDLNRIDSDHYVGAERLRTHELSLGHPALIQRVDSVEKDLGNMDTTLQREMRLLDAKGAADLEALDIRLQREMDLKQEADNAKIMELRRRVNRLEKKEIN